MKRLILCAVAVMMAVAVSAGESMFKDGYRGNVEVKVGALADNYLSLGVLTSHGYGSSYGLYAGVGTGIMYAPEH